MEQKKELDNEEQLEKTLTKKEKKLLDKVIRDKMKQAREKAKKYGSRFKDQTKKSLLTALIAAFGFIIALAWRDFITEYTELLVSLTPLQGKLVHAVLVTIVSVIGIIIVTKLFSDNEDGK